MLPKHWRIYNNVGKDKHYGSHLYKGITLGITISIYYYNKDPTKMRSLVRRSRDLWLVHRLLI